MSAPHSIGTAIEQLFDVSALIECAEPQLDEDAGNPTVRVLRIAFDKLKTSIEYLDMLDTKAE
ncbi:MAG: hypothetical protein IPL05_04520 [Betaproteobacteria bacterium]|nr:hypothetical protein [Betaproteobacteria bacterium]